MRCCRPLKAANTSFFKSYELMCLIVSVCGGIKWSCVKSFVQKVFLFVRRMMFPQILTFLYYYFFNFGKLPHISCRLVLICVWFWLPVNVKVKYSLCNDNTQQNINMYTLFNTQDNIQTKICFAVYIRNMRSVKKMYCNVNCKVCPQVAKARRPWFSSQVLYKVYPIHKNIYGDARSTD